jgi:hypothetical protein
MTTVAYRAGVLAADSSCWEGETNVHGVRKVFRVRGVIVGCAGRLSEIQAFIRWIRNGADESEYPKMADLAALVITDDGKVNAFENFSPDPIPVIGPYCSIGAGSDIALGAMWAGASSVDAIRAARAHNSVTSGRIQTLRIKSLKTTKNKPANGVKNGPLDGPRNRSSEAEDGKNA